MAQKDWFLGIDLGTGSCKCLVVDEQANVLGFGASEYAGASSAEKWEEQDSEAMLAGMVRAARTAVDRAGVRPGDCQAASIGGALHSVMAVDRAGRPLTGLMTWADGRAVKQAEAVRQGGLRDAVYQATGCPIHGSYPLYKLVWLRENRPEIFQQASRFISGKEYALARLTGSYLVDYNLAAGTGLLNTYSLKWDPISLEIAGVRPEQLSEVAGPREILRGLDSDLAAAMGFAPDTPLVLGSSDAVNSSIGAGAVLPGQATCMVGTSGALRTITPQPVLDPHARSWCYAMDPEHYLVGGALNNGGIALTWLRDVFNQACSESSGAPIVSFQDLLALAGSVPSGAQGMLCLPYFAGERSPHWNLNARGVFFGMTLQHNASHLARALLEAVAFRLRSLLDVLEDAAGPIAPIRASGGFTRSDLWLQIVSNALNRELQVPVYGETSGLGAAFWAMLGTQPGLGLEALAGLIPVGKRYLPLPEDVATYDRLYQISADLYDRLGPLFDQIAGYQNEVGL